MKKGKISFLTGLLSLFIFTCVFTGHGFAAFAQHDEAAETEEVCAEAPEAAEEPEAPDILQDGELRGDADSPEEEEGEIRVGQDGQYATLAEAFKSVAGAPGAYVFDIGTEHTEPKAIKLPKGEFSITIKGGSLKLKSPVITANCDLVIDTELCSLTRKAPSVKVAAGKQLLICREQASLSKISGTKTSILKLEADVTLDTLKSFASVDCGEAVLHVTKSVSAVGTLNGACRTDGSAKFADIGNALLYVQEAKAAKTVIEKVSGTLSVCVGAGEALAGGTHIFQYNGKQPLDPGKVKVLNKTAAGNELTAYQYGKQVKAEYAGSLTVFVGGESDSWIEMGEYPSFEKAFAVMTEAKSYWIYVNCDMKTEKITLPKTPEELTIHGSHGIKTLDLGKTKTLKAACNLRLIDLRPISGGAPVKVSSSGKIWLNLGNVELASVTTDNWLRLDGDVVVYGNVSTHGLYATKTDPELSFRTLTVKKGGMQDFSRPITLKVIDQNGEPVHLGYGQEVKAVKKYAGYFSDKQLRISVENISGAKLELRGTKLYAVSAGEG